MNVAGETTSRLQEAVGTTRARTVSRLQEAVRMTRARIASRLHEQPEKTESTTGLVRWGRRPASGNVARYRIATEVFPKGFALPRDTPKYDGTSKPEDWLSDYGTAVSIAGGNK